MNIAEKRKCADKVGIEGLALLAAEMIKDFDGSLDGAIELTGKLSVINQAGTFNDYWNEKSQIGKYKSEAMLFCRSEK